jgi:hypothetical protein
MAERWACARCSNENESWAITCSSCGALRGDLSVATSTGEPAPSPETAPLASTAADPQARAPEAAPPPEPVPSPAALATPAASSALAGGPASPPAPWKPAEPAPNARRTGSFWRHIPIGWLIVLGLFVIGGIAGLITNASRSSSGEITKSGDLGVEDLRAGDCWDLKDPAAETVEKVTAVPCTNDHEYEMFFIGSMPAGPFPTETAFNAWLDANCVPAFDRYIGKPYGQSMYDIFWLQPTKEAWGDGDRSIQCSAFHPRIHRLKKSVKGSEE